jgi:uncharacterized membrane protein
MNTKILYAVTLAAYFFLLALLVAWNGWLSPPLHFPRALAILFIAGPLLFPLRGLLHGRPRTFVWASYFALVYLTFGLVGMIANPQERWLATLETLASLVMYLGAIFFARYRHRELQQQSSP